MSNLIGTTWVFNNSISTAINPMISVETTELLFESNGTRYRSIAVGTNAAMFYGNTAACQQNYWFNQNYKKITFIREPQDNDFTPDKTTFMTWLENNATQNLGTDYITNESDLEFLAAAIRSKTGTSSAISYPFGFASSVMNIDTRKALTNFIQSRSMYTSLSDDPALSKIGLGAFAFCDNLTTASFSYCKTVEASAFYYCTNLRLASFPLCEKINRGAFSHALALSSIYFPVCSQIGFYAFNACTFSEASFPLCEYIGTDAFFYCGSLTSIYFPVCSYIGEEAFGMCSNLESASFSSCITISQYAFRSCYNLSAVYFPSCTYIGSGAFQNAGKSTSGGIASFPEVLSVGGYAFSGAGFSEIYLPKCSSFSFTSTFVSCANLTFVSIPCCSSIPDYGFYDCLNLFSVYAPDVTEIGADAFFKTNIATINFSQCTKVKGYGFELCSSLSAVDLPVCTSISAHAFHSCYNLTMVSLPVCEYIGSMAFGGCSNIATLSFPSCSLISGNSFEGCNSLKSLYFMGSSMCSVSGTLDIPTLRNSSHLGYFGSMYVPSSLADTYKADTKWKIYSSRIVGI